MGTHMEASENLKMSFKEFCPIWHISISHILPKCIIKLALHKNPEYEEYEEWSNNFILPKRSKVKKTTSILSYLSYYYGSVIQVITNNNKKKRIPRCRVFVYSLLPDLNLPLIISCTCPPPVPNLRLVLSH